MYNMSNNSRKLLFGSYLAGVTATVGAVPSNCVVQRRPLHLNLDVLLAYPKQMRIFQADGDLLGPICYPGPGTGPAHGHSISSIRPGSKFI